MSEIVWEDPPPENRGGARAGVWVQRLSPLLDHPGRWALMGADVSNSIVSQLRRGKIRIPPGRWEFTSRGIGGRRAKIYARYLGPDEDPS